MKIDEKTAMMYRQWEASSAKAVLLLVHGLGGHSARWEFLADFFLQRSVSSYAIELRGFGQTQGPQGHIDSFSIYLSDIHSLYQIILRENPGQKVFLLGESLGGLLVFLLVAAGLDSCAGLICLSPAFKSRLKFSLWEYIKIFSSLVYNPRKQFRLPFDAAMCTRDIEYQRIMDSDPREYRSATSRFLWETQAAQIRAHVVRDRIDVPTLFLLAGEDVVVDTETAKWIFQDLEVEDKTIIRYPWMHHALSIELGRELVFRDILRWIEKRA